MGIEVISVGSSSSGNSYIIRAAGRVIVLDVGLPAKRIVGALEDRGIPAGDVDAVLITHEHTDHVKSVRAIGRKCCSAVFCTSRGTFAGTPNFVHVPEERIMFMSAGNTITLGAAENNNNVRISAFALSHDAAEPLSYTIEAGGDKLAVVTDTGIVTDEIYDAVKDADMLVFEANHDEQMLLFGEYPYPVKMRIKSDCGHLSNEYAGNVLARILKDRGAERAPADPACPNDACAETSSEEGKTAEAHRPTHIMLAHLSFHNNAPFFARQAVEEALEAAGFIKGEDYTLEVASKDEITCMSL